MSGSEWLLKWTWPEVLAAALAFLSFGVLAHSYGLLAALWVIPAIAAGALTGQQGRDEAQR